MKVNIEQQWESLMNTIKTHVTGTRQKQLLEFYEKLAEEDSYFHP
jgi:hypothetical protein